MEKTEIDDSVYTNDSLPLRPSLKPEDIEAGGYQRLYYFFRPSFIQFAFFKCTCSALRIASVIKEFAVLVLPRFLSWFT